MSFARKADYVGGWVSRAMHGVRRPKENTIQEIEKYLDLPPSIFFPEPPPLTSPRIHDNRLARALKTTTLSWESQHVPLSLSYARRHTGEYASNLTAWARWLRPRGSKRRRCLVYVHGWLEPGSWVEEALLFPRWTRELDIDIVHVSLPFHGPRNPKHALFSGQYFWTADLVRSLEGVRQAICDTRSLFGFLRRQGYDEIGVSGVSLGGSLAMILACLDPLPDYVIGIVCHLRLHEAVERASILWTMKQDLERFGVDETQRREIFRRIGFADYLPSVSPDRQLWIQAREDGHIDPELVIEQWHAWNKPQLYWIPGGHMTFPLHLPEITRRMGRFLERLPAKSRP